MSKVEFHPLKIVQLRKLTTDCVEVTFQVPQDKSDIFQYQAGQYLTLNTSIQGEEVRRSYSICSAPHEDKLSVAVKQIPNGRFSTFANQVLKEGDVLDVLPPTGNFVLHPDVKNNYVFFAAGSGITPILSQIKYLLANDKANKILLIFGNKNFGSIIFRDEIENLKDKYLEKFSVHHVFSREKIGTPLYFGRIDKEKCDQLLKVLTRIDQVDEYYICGPNEMIFNIKEVLESQGVNSNKIKFELFNTDGLKKATPQKQTLDKMSDKSSDIIIRMDGDLFEFSLDYSGQNLLDAAIENGADLPYSCRGGVCCTCKAKVIEGQLEMDVNYALEPDEVAAGYVLLCQSHPRTDKVFVDFDQN